MAMISPTPNTPSMDKALMEHALGGRAVFKAPLYTHAVKEAQARMKGFGSVPEWERAKDAERDDWWGKFMKGGLEDGANSVFKEGPLPNPSP